MNNIPSCPLCGNKRYGLRKGWSYPPDDEPFLAYFIIGCINCEERYWKRCSSTPRELVVRPHFTYTISYALSGKYGIHFSKTFPDSADYLQSSACKVLPEQILGVLDPEDVARILDKGDAVTAEDILCSNTFNKGNMLEESKYLELVKG